MQSIHYTSLQLASPDPASGLVGPAGLQVNGAQTVDDAGFLRAVARTFYGRGQKTTDLRFRVTRQFSSVRALEVFCLMHHSELPVQGDLQITAGVYGDTTVVTLEDAVLAGFNIVAVLGVSAVVEYSFRGGLFTTEEVTLPEEDSTVKVKVVTLTAADVSKAVTFDTPFGSVPRFVQGIISPPDGGVAFFALPRESTRTAEGITFDFTAAVPASGTYKLLVQAVL